MYPINCPKIEGDACEENRHTGVRFADPPDAVIFGYETGYWPNLHNAVIQYVESSQLVKSIMKCNHQVNMHHVM